MTITYSLDVANTRFCGFAKLLGRWKGSIYKILWKEFIVFLAGYSLLSVTYRFFLSEPQKSYHHELDNFPNRFLVEDRQYSLGALQSVEVKRPLRGVVGKF
ncbi:hypothetical protein AVEN_100894-1 [Araneus ventricosus]|uniref:Bestrophin homolog n=1 Tax=Araneus ventricosus TaxID=182803 RepID=A0A4Y2AWC6_ARAVE|nr:hypothetical protein AVEN_100894-1 [Araneus ventricosus]